MENRSRCPRQSRAIYETRLNKLDTTRRTLKSKATSILDTRSIIANTYGPKVSTTAGTSDLSKETKTTETKTNNNMKTIDNTKKDEKEKKEDMEKACKTEIEGTQLNDRSTLTRAAINQNKKTNNEKGISSGYTNWHKVKNNIIEKSDTTNENIMNMLLEIQQDIKEIKEKEQVKDIDERLELVKTHCAYEILNDGENDLKTLKIVTQNIRGMTNITKQIDWLKFCEDKDLDIIGIMETWAKDENCKYIFKNDTIKEIQRKIKMLMNTNIFEQMDNKQMVQESES
ncbi:2179_t:CDS:2 [Diversispora eburnea]|uniref:2179_t:CDS:1 n=1 Tax=Diversispora eburnea TaxID=1213867 RepID=A0A9N9G631_9GLOM|nr:2179_t:CDS:2 [Diversispora eburnea]